MIAVPVEPGFETLQFESFAAKDDQPQSQACGLGLIDLDELAEGGGGLVEDGDALGAEQVVEGFGRAAYPVRNHDQAAAVEESAPEFPDGEVEGIGVKESPDIAMIEVKPGTGGGKETSDIMVADQSALGLAGGA